MGNNKIQKLKILLLINSLKIGGAEIVFTKLFEYLKKQGHQPFLGVIKDPGFENENLIFSDAVVLPVNNLFDIDGLRKIIKFIKDNEIGVVYSTLDYANVVSRIIKFFIPSLKVIIRESGTADRKSIKLKIYDVVLNIFCNKIIAVSNEVKNTLIAYQPFYKNKIAVINNGIEIVMSEDEILNNINNRPVEQVTILNVGNMNNENKNQSGLISAIHELVKINPSIDIVLKLVGDGAIRNKLEAMTKLYGLENKVVFVGRVNPDQMKKLYLSADLFIINSKKEGLSNALLEAMSFGLPVISTKTGGAMEVIENGKSGFLIESDNQKELIDKIEKLIKNRGLRKEMGIAAYTMVKNNYSLENQFSKLLSFFG